jgi:hypothetical protein
MADMLNEPECHEAVGEQAQGPALPPLWRGATREGNQMGLDLARELLGRAWRQRLMVEVSDHGVNPLKINGLIS